MEYTEKDKAMIKNYESDEEMMIHIFAQWCMNHDIDAIELYERAYPKQPANQLLKEALEKTRTKEEAIEISTEAVLHVLQQFGNDDLAFVVYDTVNEKTDD